MRRKEAKGYSSMTGCRVIQIIDGITSPLQWKMQGLILIEMEITVFMCKLSYWSLQIISCAIKLTFISYLHIHNSIHMYFWRQRLVAQNRALKTLAVIQTHTEQRSKFVHLGIELLKSVFSNKTYIKYTKRNVFITHLCKLLFCFQSVKSLPQ